MPKEYFHPNAYLDGIRNVRRGLRARTKILNALETATEDAKTLASQSGVSYGVAMHHLKLLAKSGVVECRDGRPHIWASTGLGQKRLTSVS